MTIHISPGGLQEFTGLDLAGLIRAQVQFLSEGHGLEFRQGYDFAEFERLHGKILDADPELQERKPLQPWFDRSVEPDLGQKAFWLAAFRWDEPVYIEANRLFVCNNDFRSDCISWLLSAHCLAGVPGIIAPPTGPASAESRQLTGNTVCRGEVTLVPGMRFGPDSTLGQDLTSLALMLIYAEWRDVTGVWGLSTPRQAARGQMYRLGHNYQEPNFIHWTTKPKCVTAEDGWEMLVITSRSRIMGLIREVRERVRLAATPVQAAKGKPAGTRSQAAREKAQPPCAPSEAA